MSTDIIIKTDKPKHLTVNQMLAMFGAQKLRKMRERQNRLFKNKASRDNGGNYGRRVLIGKVCERHFHATKGWRC